MQRWLVASGVASGGITAAAALWTVHRNEDSGLLWHRKRGAYHAEELLADHSTVTILEEEQQQEQQQQQKHANAPRLIGSNYYGICAPDPQHPHALFPADVLQQPLRHLALGQQHAGKNDCKFIN